MIYAVVTFGPAPNPRVFRHPENAIKIAEWLPNTARVYACESAQLARTADISRLRAGERVIWARS